VDRTRNNKLQGYHETRKGSKTEAEKIGGKFTSFWTFGKDDAIVILEALNEEAAMQFGLKVGSLRNIRTTTLRSATEEEIANVIDKLSQLGCGISLS
jgi:uncharacterized protein with GYD domain